MKAVIYARYSSHSQTEQSIEGQLHDNYAWASQQGITVVGEYIDRALSGTRDLRPDFQRMIEDASKKQFDMIIVWKLDRFARNRYDSAIYKARLRKYDVKVVSVKENITDTPEGIILEGLLESLAEYYSANLAQNIKRGRRESLLKGLFPGGPAPFGYKVVDKKLVVDDKTAPVVRFIFDKYAEGVPKKDIMKSLDERGIRNKQGRPLTLSFFNRILTNPIYYGTFRQLDQTFPNFADPIIDEDLFNRVQARLKRVARAPAASKGKVDYLLTGKIFCGHCGFPMSGESGKSHTGDVHHYYACHNKKKFRACRKKNERKNFIEWYITEQTMRYITNPACAARVAREVVAEYKREFSDAGAEDLERAIQQIDREMEKLVDAILDAPKAARTRIYERMESLDAQKKDLDADLSRLRIAAKIDLTENDVRAWLQKFSSGDPTDPDFQRHIIDSFVSSVYVYDNRVAIFYNVRGGKQVSYIDLLSALPDDLTPDSTPTDLTPDSSPDSPADSSQDASPEKVRISNPTLHFTTPNPNPKLIFVNGMFGILIYREPDDR